MRLVSRITPFKTLRAFLNCSSVGMVKTSFPRLDDVLHKVNHTQFREESQWRGRGAGADFFRKGWNFAGRGGGRLRSCRGWSKNRKNRGRAPWGDWGEKAGGSARGSAGCRSGWQGLTSQLYLTVWAEGLPGLHRRHPLPGPAGDHDAGEPPPGHWAGHRTVRGDDAAGTGPGGRDAAGEALRMEYPGGVFYLCYDCVLCLLIRDRRTASLGADGSGLSGQ